MRLTSSQRGALEYFDSYARARQEKAERLLESVRRMGNIRLDDLSLAVENLRRYAQVALHFHPDRIAQSGQTVVEELLEHGLYQSQFLTGISNGSVSAHPEGDRDRWEERLFGGAYHQSGFRPEERPKYGALNLFRLPDGPAPRFGSCYFLLRPEVSHRCTLTYLDSHLEPEERGTLREFDLLLAALFEETFLRESVLNQPEWNATRLLRHLQHDLQQPFEDPAGKRPGRRLNHYVEAQVHGTVQLGRDAETLVADPSFRSSSTGLSLEALCKRYDLSLFWHSGFVLPVHSVPVDFRGPNMPSLAQRVAPEGVVDAAKIGRAVQGLHRAPEEWSERGSVQEVLQELKLLWHVLVRFGEPLTP